jgi:hypothetical protein
MCHHRAAIGAAVLARGQYGSWYRWVWNIVGSMTVLLLSPEVSPVARYRWLTGCLCFVSLSSGPVDPRVLDVSACVCS